MQIIKLWARRAWALLSMAGTLWNLAQWVGWAPMVTGIVFMVLATVGGIFERLPYTVTAVLALAAFASVFTVVTVAKAAKHIAGGAQTSPVAHKAWNEVNEFMLFQAACLWAGIEPVYPLPLGEPYARFTMLKEAVRNGELVPVQTIGTALESLIRYSRREKMHANALTFVTRTALRQFADRRRLKPRSLFPDA